MPGTQFGLDQRRFKIDLKFTLQFYGIINHEPRPATEGGNDGFDHTIKCYIVRPVADPGSHRLGNPLRLKITLGNILHGRLPSLDKTLLGTTGRRAFLQAPAQPEATKFSVNARLTVEMVTVPARI